MCELIRSFVGSSVRSLHFSLVRWVVRRPVGSPGSFASWLAPRLVRQFKFQSVRSFIGSFVRWLVLALLVGSSVSSVVNVLACFILSSLVRWQVCWLFGSLVRWFVG